MNTGNNNGGGGFRGFASKLREQAKDAVQVAGNLNNYKLPSFDDMAQNDQYIHSPDFNVRGSMSSANTTGGTASATETTTMAANNNNNNNNNVETATADDVASYYSHSTGSSWSLLDRTGSSLLDRSNINNINNNNDNNDNKSDANEIVSTAVQPTKQSESESESDPAKITRQQQTARTSSVSLLSVVTDTLQQQQPTRPGIGAGSTNYDTSSMNTMSNSNDNGSVDDSSEDFDEEDPILSMIRNKDKQVAGGSNGSGSGNSDGNGNGDDAPTSVITIRNPKPSNRFMEDVRLQTPLHQPQQTIDEMLANGASQEKSGMQPEDPNTGDNRSSGPFGGYFKNMALDSLNRFKLGLNSKQQQQQQQQQQLRTPPLSRGRKKIQQTLPRDEESDYEITTSAGMLGEDDLEHLKQLQLGSASAGPSKLAMMLRAEFWNEHKHFLFIAFTLGLAIYVYFFANTVKDDVT